MNKMKLRKIITVFMLLNLVFITNIYASGTCGPDDAFSISCIFDRGNNISGSNNDYNKVEGLVNKIGTGIVKPIGYLIFAIVTVILGVQYIWSGYNGKSKVKETLPVFICAVVFFYLAENVIDVVTGVIGYDVDSETGGTFNSFTDLTGNIWVNVCNVVQILAFAGILFIGVKYLMENSEGRAKIKERLTPMLIGIIFVFCAANVVSYIVRIGDSVL